MSFAHVFFSRTETKTTGSAASILDIFWRAYRRCLKKTSTVGVGSCKLRIAIVPSPSQRTRPLEVVGRIVAMRIRIGIVLLALRSALLGKSEFWQFWKQE
jgi:hypothetical protein